MPRLTLVVLAHGEVLPDALASALDLRLPDRVGRGRGTSSASTPRVSEARTRPAGRPASVTLEQFGGDSARL
jgi:hypothetical protein